MGKTSLSEIVRLVDQILEPGYHPKNRKKVSIARYQVGRFYPTLRKILMPSRVRDNINPPERWGEPLVQYYLEGLRQVYRGVDYIHINNAEVESDRVYSCYLNPDIRKSIRERKMKEATYRHLESLIGGLDSKLLPSESKALIKTSTKLTVNTEPDVVKRLDSSSNTILAAESNLSLRTVKKYRAREHKGNQIADFGFVLKHQKTSGDVSNRLMLAQIDDWESLIEAARSIGYSVRALLRVLRSIGSNQASDIIGLIDDAISMVANYAQDHNISNIKAWHILFNIYSTTGAGNIDRSMDILSQGYFFLDEETDVPELYGNAPWASPQNNGAACDDMPRSRAKLITLHLIQSGLNKLKRTVEYPPERTKKKRKKK